jgi:hypothetical protein
MGYTLRLITTDKPLCLLYSMAMLLNQDPDVLAKYMGTSAIYIEAWQWFIKRSGMCLVPYVLEANEPGYVAKHDIPKHKGILECLTNSSIKHAVAWDGKRIFNPCPKVTDYSITTAWILRS